MEDLKKQARFIILLDIHQTILLISLAFSWLLRE